MKKLFILLTMMAAILGSCGGDSDLNKVYSFVGDSLIARWDLSYFFPACLTRNDGVSGSGVQYLESLGGKYAGGRVVVLSGTNDLGLVPSGDEQAYAERFVEAVSNLGAGRVIVISIPPRSRNWCHNELDDNTRIRAMNASIAKECGTRPGFTYVDVFDLLMRDGYLNGEYTHDGLHMSEQGYEIITKKIKDIL